MLWKNRVFMKMFFAYGLATLGGWFDFVAVAILFGFVWQADAMTIALLPIMYAGPGILFGQIAGILADRWNKLRIMLISDFIRALFTILLIFAPDPLWALLIILCRSTANVFHTPAQQAMTRFVVPEEHLLKATTLNGTVFQMSKVFGPLLGGSVAAVFSPAACMLINACSFVLSAFFLLSIGKSAEVSKAGNVVAKRTEKIGLRDSWKEGWLIILRNRILFVSLIFSVMAMFAIQMVDAQFTVILREKAPEHPELVGWKTTAIGAGALLTVAWLNRYNKLASYGWILGGGTILIGVLITWLGLYKTGQPIILLLVASFIGGLGTGLTSVGANYLRHKETPKEAAGRVMGIFDSITSAVFIVAPLLGGLFITAIGVSEAFQLIGYIVGAIGLCGVIFQAQLWGKPAKAGIHQEQLTP